MNYLAVIFGSIVLCWALQAPAANSWSNVRTPVVAEPASAIGFYSAGCLTGAVPLPLKGEGFQVMRPSRHRYFGHPRLIAFIERLSRQAMARQNRLLIGDLSQPRGGPMSYGHRSHQLGLDVDIWFFQGPRERDLTPHETENMPMPSMVRAGAGLLDFSRWSTRYQHLLKIAAKDPEVQRIFVNPVIKQWLCQQERVDRSWLNKIRPWWGHDAHFHVRLRCPSGSNTCQTQDPPPTDPGCDKHLDQWVRELRLAAQSPSQTQKKSPRKTILLPEICETVLKQP